jgi:ribulose-5-phosphate 4-epimerase/fuculose-1-phosphate aldolase
MRGETVDGGPKASTESGIHLVVYENARRCGRRARAPAARGRDVDRRHRPAGPFIPEIIVTIGGIPTASFGTPGTNELADSIRDSSSARTRS